MASPFCVARAAHHCRRFPLGLSLWGTNYSVFSCNFIHIFCSITAGKWPNLPWKSDPIDWEWWEGISCLSASPLEPPTWRRPSPIEWLEESGTRITTVSPVRRVKLVDIVASEAGTTRCANICKTFIFLSKRTKNNLSIQSRSARSRKWIIISGIRACEKLNRTLAQDLNNNNKSLVHTTTKRFVRRCKYFHLEPADRWNWRNGAYANRVHVLTANGNGWAARRLANSSASTVAGRVAPACTFVHIKFT